MHCNVWYDNNLHSTNLCDQHLTRIIHINKTCAEKIINVTSQYNTTPKLTTRARIDKPEM